jgi:hypothetical protein
VKRNQKHTADGSASLARPVGVKGGPELRTLADVRAYILTLTRAASSMPTWCHIIEYVRHL